MRRLRFDGFYHVVARYGYMDEINHDHAFMDAVLKVCAGRGSRRAVLIVVRIQKMPPGLPRGLEAWVASWVSKGGCLCKAARRTHALEPRVCKTIPTLQLRSRHTPCLSSGSSRARRPPVQSGAGSSSSWH